MHAVNRRELNELKVSRKAEHPMCGLGWGTPHSHKYIYIYIHMYVKVQKKHFLFISSICYLSKSTSWAVAYFFYYHRERPAQTKNIRARLIPTMKLPSISMLLGISWSFTWFNTGSSQPFQHGGRHLRGRKPGETRWTHPLYSDGRGQAVRRLNDTDQCLGGEPWWSTGENHRKSIFKSTRNPPTSSICLKSLISLTWSDCLVANRI